MPEGIGYPPADASSSVFSNPQIIAALQQLAARGNSPFPQQQMAMPQIQPRQAPQVVQPDLGQIQSSPMGMNPMLAQVMQRLGQPGGVAAATAPAPVMDVLKTPLGMGGIGSR